MAQSGPDSDTQETTVTGTQRGDADGADEREWQFGLDDVGPDGAIEDEPDPIEPGQPKLENVIFVLIGIIGMLLLLSTVL